MAGTGSQEPFPILAEHGNIPLVCQPFLGQARHAFGKIQGNDPRLRVAPGEQGGEPSGAAADLQDTPDAFAALHPAVLGKLPKQAGRQILLHLGMGVIGSGGAGKPLPDSLFCGLTHLGQTPGREKGRGRRAR